MTSSKQNMQERVFVAVPHMDDKSLVNGDGVPEDIILIDSSPGPRSPSSPGPVCWTPSGRRRLAIMSIVCGVSCVGIKALLLALQAERARVPAESRALSRRSLRLSVLSICLWLAALLCLPLLLVFLSYVLARVE
ncbi:transmembrane protein 265 [Ascaphus truei]|uniref:transmembrane protein 265 n=1 Tax=Ascaphus truei TaxID=8439 RepID=UPI003F59C56C